MDANGDGVLQFEEIINHYKGVDSHVLDALKDMFKENDYNNDGVVSKRELFQLALRLSCLAVSASNQSTRISQQRNKLK